MGFVRPQHFTALIACYSYTSLQLLYVRTEIIAGCTCIHDLLISTSERQYLDAVCYAIYTKCAVHSTYIIFHSGEMPELDDALRNSHKNCSSLNT